MEKRLQNKVAESKLTLPVTAAVAVVVWLLAGLVQGGMWAQFACFVVTTYLMVELNNSYALIRIYSRTVSCSFILLACAACFTFKSWHGAVAELCAVASYIALFRTYQDHHSAGWTFYTFLCVGAGSVAYVHILYYVPVLWLLMAARLGSLNGRSLAASLIGLATPYWFAMLYVVYTGDFATAGEHFAQLWQFGRTADFSTFGLPQLLTLALVVALSVTGTVHYIRTSYKDRIRIRMFYGCFITANLTTLVFLLLQPQHFDLLIRMMIINTSPLIAHFLALTKTKATNIAFCAIVAATVIITAYNLWTLSLTSS